MAMPVLLTVGALGVAWVALSRERAKPSTATVGGPEAAGTAGTAGAGVTTVGTDMGTAVVSPTGDPTGVGGSTGCDPTVSPATPATTVTEPAKTDPVGGIKFGGTVPKHLNVASTADLKYGNVRGITRQQEAGALTELGPASGMVW